MKSASELRFIAAEQQRLGRFWEAARSLGRVIEAADAGDTTADRLVLARLCDELGETRRALSHLRHVLEHHPKNAPALDQLATMLLTRGQLEPAARAMGRLAAALDEEPRLRAEALVRLAKIEALLGGAPRTAWALREALSELGPCGSAGEAWRGLAHLAGGWEAFEATVERYLGERGGHPAEHVALANVQADRRADIHGAVATLERAAAVFGPRLDLDRALGERLVAARRVEEGLRRLRGAAMTWPLEPASWRSLARGLNLAGERVEGLRMLEPLKVLGLAHDPEQEAIAGRPALELTGQASLSELAAVARLAPMLPGPPVIIEGAEAAADAPLGEAVSQLSERLARALSVRATVLRASDEIGLAIVPPTADTAGALVVSARLARRSHVEQVFVLATGLAALVLGEGGGDGAGAPAVGAVVADALLPCARRLAADLGLSARGAAPPPDSAAVGQLLSVWASEEAAALRAALG